MLKTIRLAGRGGGRTRPTKTVTRAKPLLTPPRTNLVFREERFKSTVRRTIGYYEETIECKIK